MPCIIFAGGKSSRMGEDKALLPFSTFNTLTEYQFTRLSKLFKNVYISAKSADKFPLHLQEYVLQDIVSNISAPTIGFVSLFQQLEGDTFFILSVDTPFVQEQEIYKLIKNNHSCDASIAKTSEGIHPLCGVYHRSLEKNFNDMLQNNQHKLGMLLKNSNTNFVTFTNEEAFSNLNHPHEYQLALKKCYN